jgi:CDP-diacylglycerol--glycerol-3-phosphate 3-phosphatidyltransferase
VTWEEYAEAWSRLHGGFDPAAAPPVVRGWVRTAYRTGCLLAAWRVGPMSVTTAGLIVGLAVPAVVPFGRGGVLLAALLVLLAAVFDGLDGAVAVVSGRASRLGYVYDSVADRLGEMAWLLALWLVGAPGWLVVAAGAAGFLQEYARARATAAGMTGIGVVTVAERPTRVLLAVAGLGIGALVTSLATVAAAAWFALALVGLAQLAVAVRRALA